MSPGSRAAFRSNECHAAQGRFLRAATCTSCRWLRQSCGAGCGAAGQLFHDRPQSCWHICRPLLFLSSIPIKTKAIACLRAVPRKHLEVILVGLGGVEAATLVLAAKATATLVQVEALPQHPIVHEVLAQALTKLVRLPKGVLLVLALALLRGQVPGCIAVKATRDGVKPLSGHSRKTPLYPLFLHNFYARIR
jgi:hypothetical protein